MSGLWDDVRRSLREARARLAAADASLEVAFEAMEALSALGAASLHRSHVAPGHFTASAFVLSPDGARTLLIRHRTLGLWLQPGGHFEPGDATLTEAAAREAEEETGVCLGAVEQELFHVDVHRVPANLRRGEATHLHHDLRVLFRAASDQLVAREEVAGAAWFSWEDLAGLETDDSVRRACGSIRRGGFGLG